MLHKITNVIDRVNQTVSESGKHRIGREVHVDTLSFNTPAMLYHKDGVTITSPVESIMEQANGDLTIVTMNTIYHLESIPL